MQSPRTKMISLSPPDGKKLAAHWLPRGNWRPPLAVLGLALHEYDCGLRTGRGRRCGRSREEGTDLPPAVEAAVLHEQDRRRRVGRERRGLVFMIEGDVHRAQPPLDVVGEPPLGRVARCPRK